MRREIWMAEFMMFICDIEGAKNSLPPEDVKAHYERVSAWWTDHENAGRIVAGVARRLQSTNTAKTVRVEAGTGTVLDGPFAETKEQVGGFGVPTCQICKRPSTWSVRGPA
jgi:hypothetical protein